MLHFKQLHDWWLLGYKHEQKQKIHNFLKVIVDKMSLKWLSLLLLLQLTCYFSSGRCGKVLVWPMEYSHWINMKIILEELVSRGHEVTVLTSPAAVVVDVNKSSTIKFEIFPTSITKDYFDNFVKQFIEKWRHATKD